MKSSLEKTSTMDNVDQMRATAASTTTVFVDFFSSPEFSDTSSAVASISQFRSQVASRAVNLLDQLRRDYLSGERGLAPAGPYLGKTRLLYEFVRVTLGIRMHGSENYSRFVNGLGVEDVSIGQNISLIHEVSLNHTCLSL
jgi:phenylalanine ammonia-lyase